MKKGYFFLLSMMFLCIFTFSAGYASAIPAPESPVAVPAPVPAAEDSSAFVAALTVAQPSAADEVAAPDTQLIPVSDTNEVATRAVEKNVGLFSKRIKDRFALYLSRSGQYLDLMKNILREKNVPEDIVFLSLIESGFNPNAYSIARAAGPWQFISSTAKRYGLEINWWKDERRDPVKSTVAAADYLKDLYGMFGSWSLAMAAYNAGEGKIQKAIKRSKSDDYWDLLGTRHIRNETKEYVPRFIAASMIAANPQEFGFNDIEYRAPMSYDEVTLESPIDLAVAADCAETDLDTIKKLNPELRRWCTPPDMETYVLRIPKGKKDVFLEKLKTVPEDERFTISRYTVRKNDTFRKIAKKTGVSEYVIMSLNPSGKILPLTAGTQIYIPPKGLFVADPDDRHSLKKTVSYKRHKAHSGKISGKGRLKKRSLSARHHTRSAKHHRSARHHS